MDAQDHIKRLLIEEVGEVLYPGGGKAFANSGIPYIPCKWNGFHPDSALTPGTQTNLLPDFTWVGCRYEQVGDRMQLVPTQASAVYRKYDPGTRSVRCLIPDDPQGKNRARLEKMAEWGKKPGQYAEYEPLLAPTNSLGVLQGMNRNTIEQLRTMLAQAESDLAGLPVEPEVTSAAGEGDGF